MPDNIPLNSNFISLEDKTIIVAGPEDLIVTVGQQLTWLGAACRESIGELAYCYAKFDEVETSLAESYVPTFSITYEVVPISAQEPRSCWNDFVGNLVVVPGFPVSERLLDETGLELPLEIMACLGGMPLITQYGGGYILKGRSTMLIPVERREDSVQWHLVSKDRGRISYKDLLSLCPMRLQLQALDKDALFSTRAFLGWCSKSVNYLGMFIRPL